MENFTIRLENLQFHSRIGLYEQERIVGNDFIVDIRIVIPADRFEPENIDTTVNYAEVYGIVEKTMGETLLLIETAARKIADGIKSRFQHIRHISVKLTKVAPPIPGMRGSASAEFSQDL